MPIPWLPNIKVSTSAEKDGEIVKFINLTPHIVVFCHPDGGEDVFEVSHLRTHYDGRVEEQIQNCAPVRSRLTSFRLVSKIRGEANIPPPKKGVRYIVPDMTRLACPDRKDLVSPDTGSSCIRDERGMVKAVTAFIINV